MWSLERGNEEAGYQPQAYCVGADDVGASHRRKRIWIVGRLAHAGIGRRGRDNGDPTRHDRALQIAGRCSSVGLTAGGRHSGRQDHEGCGQAGADRLDAVLRAMVSDGVLRWDQRRPTNATRPGSQSCGDSWGLRGEHEGSYAA